MRVFPAIDLLNGHSVRLYQGDYQQVTPVSSDPLAQAKSFVAAGLSRIHLVDLDGAKAGQPENFDVIQKIRQATDLFVEVGGGIRDMTTIKRYLTLGVDRVILGSSALKQPELVVAALAEFGPARIVVGIDGTPQQVATEGWLAQSNVTMADLMGAMTAKGVTQFIVTDVTKDGTLQGPNVALLANLQAKYPQATVVASGGLRDYQDLEALKAAGLNDVIVGKALVKGTITLAELAQAEVALC